MFDSHVHLLPGVDDGAKDFAQSIEMLERAKADGVTHWIVTPHLNHVCSQYSYEALREAFTQWREALRQNTAYNNLLFGVEVYIDEEYLAELSTMQSLPTFENSKYMLIEFNRTTKLETMQAAIHELKLRGVKPIIAHVEAYKDLVTHPEYVKALCDDGAMVQVSANTFLDKRYHKFIKALMGLNAIDLVASDGHNLHARQPVLKEVYNWVKNHYSVEWANRLFIDSPKVVFNGHEYDRPFTIIKPRKSYYISLAATAMVGLALLVTGVSQLGNIDFINRTPSEIAGVNDDETLTDESMPAGAAEQGEAQASSETTANTTTEDINANKATTTTTTTTSSATTEAATQAIAAVPTYDEVVNTYMDQLYALQNQYTADVERIYNSIQDTRNFVTDEAKRKATIDAYLEEAGNLETICDNNVYAVLYEFQNELELHDYDVAIIEESRAEYHRIKEETKNTYLNNF